MFLFKFWSFIFGYIHIIVEGQNLERFVNMAISRGIFLWDIKRVGDNKIFLKARVNSFRPLKHICRRVGCRLRISQKIGWPFIGKKIRQRKMMVAGLVVFLCTLYVLSSVIWFVDVKGNKHISRSEIIKLAEKQGLKPGRFKWGLDLDKIQKELNDKVEGAAWVGVEIRGTRVVVEIAEKVMPPSDADRLPANVVAKKMGLVKEILVLKGNPLVKEGELVRQGQVLISGEIWPQEDPAKKAEENKTSQPKEEQKRQPELVRAKGTVRARIWYEGYGESPIIESGQRKTGITSEAIRLKVYGRTIILKGPKNSPYKLFTVEQKVKRIPKWRNILIPVELINTNYFELKSYQIEHGPSEALMLATDHALTQINKKIPKQRKILSKKTEQIMTNDENLVRVKVMIETLEDIGTMQIMSNKEAAN